MPKIVDHEQRRSELAAAACRVIAEEGIEAATVQRIAEAGGCTTGRVTHYFDDKEAVLIAALRRVHTAAGARMLALPKHGDPVWRLRSVLLEALPLDDVRRMEWRVWLAFWGKVSASPLLLEEQRVRYAEWRGLVRGLLASVRPDSGRAVQQHQADKLIALIDGLGIQAVLEPQRLTPKRIAGLLDLTLAEITACD